MIMLRVTFGFWLLFETLTLSGIVTTVRQTRAKYRRVKKRKVQVVEMKSNGPIVHLNERWRAPPHQHAFTKSCSSETVGFTSVVPLLWTTE